MMKKMNTLAISLMLSGIVSGVVFADSLTPQFWVDSVAHGKNIPNSNGPSGPYPNNDYAMAMYDAFSKSAVFFFTAILPYVDKGVSPISKEYPQARWLCTTSNVHMNKGPQLLANCEIVETRDPMAPLSTHSMFNVSPVEADVDTHFNFSKYTLYITSPKDASFVYSFDFVPAAS